MRHSIASLAAVLLLAASCATPTNISYFQDCEDLDLAFNASAKPILLQPGDKISIIVNCKDQQLSNLFNLPYTTRYLGAQTDTYSSYNQGVNGYTVDLSGEIDFPVLGKVMVSGLSREEVSAKVKTLLEANKLVRDPVVTVDFMNLTISVMGEVVNPGRYNINKDKLTILDAISMAGDLTIYGVRENVCVIREEAGKQQTYRINLLSTSDVVNSPVYYVRQNDIIYVQPNDMRIRQSTVNGNNVRTTSFWISLASLAATITNTLVIMMR